MTTTTEMDTVSAKNLREGDRIVAVYNPDAKRRQPSGWRQGDTVVTGAFVSLPEFRVKQIVRDNETTQILPAVEDARWMNPVANDTCFEILRVVTF